MRSNGVHLSLALVASIGAVSLVGCGGGEGDSARLAQTVDATRNNVTTLKLVDNPGYVHYSSYYQFELVGVDENGKETKLTDKATWTINSPTVDNIGTIKNGYFDAAEKQGDFILRAEYAGLTAVEKKIIVSNANLTGIVISHKTNIADECQTTTFDAEAHFEGNLVLPYDMTWAVTEGNTLAKFKDANKSTLSTTASGEIKIRASAKDNDGKQISSNQLPFTIDNSLLTISITSDKNDEMRNGETANLTVNGTFKNDPATNVKITDSATLSATPSDLIKFEGAKITAQNGTANGSPVVIAGKCGGETGELKLTVKEKQIKSIEIKSDNGSTDNLSVTEGSNIDLDVTAIFADNAKDPDYKQRVFWRIDEGASDDFDDDKVSIDEDGTLRVDGDLNLTRQITIEVIAEILEDGDVVTGSDGADLDDDITITIKPE